MSAPELLPSALSLVACIVILRRVEPALNRMSCNTLLTVRLALFLLLVGASVQILDILLGNPPAWPAVVLAAGVAVLMLCERRLRVLIPRPRPRQRARL